MGTQSPTPKGAEPHSVFGPRLLWPNGCMDQGATWYGGRPRPTRHCVLCGPSYPQKKGHTHLHPCLFWPNGWMDEDAAWYGSRTRPRPHCTRRGTGSPERGTAAPPPPLFGSCLLWPRSPVSATAELLLNCLWFYIFYPQAPGKIFLRKLAPYKHFLSTTRRRRLSPSILFYVVDSQEYVHA